MSSTNQYSVGFEYNNEGYVYQIIIKTRSIDEIIKIQNFNVTFLAYSGKTITGEQLLKLTSDIITSNQMNPEHQINIYTPDTQNLQEINAEDNYEIIISYDYEGYINRMDAIKKS